MQQLRNLQSTHSFRATKHTASYTLRVVLLTFTIGLCAILAVITPLPSASAHSNSQQTTPTPQAFTITEIALLNDPATGHSLLSGVRAWQGPQYTYEFSVSDMADSGCFNAWVTFRHSSQASNIALRIFCNRLELHAHANGTDTLGPTQPFSMHKGNEYRLRIVANGSSISVYQQQSATFVLLMQWQMPTNAAPVSGPTVTLYAAGGTNVCWDNITGTPSTPGTPGTLA